MRQQTGDNRKTVVDVVVTTGGVAQPACVRAHFNVVVVAAGLVINTGVVEVVEVVAVVEAIGAAVAGVEVVTKPRVVDGVTGIAVVGLDRVVDRGISTVTDSGKITGG